MFRTRSMASVGALLSLLFLPVPGTIGAQERREGGLPPYDIAREVRVSGTVIRSYTVSPVPDLELSILAVTIDGRAVQLILAPSDFVTKQAITFAAGTTVEVTGIPGSHVDDEPAMWVRKVKAGTHTLTLRDDAGNAIWEKVWRPALPGPRGVR